MKVELLNMLGEVEMNQFETIFEPTKLKPREGVEIELRDTRGSNKAAMNGAFILPLVAGEEVKFCAEASIKMSKESIIVELELFIRPDKNGKQVPSEEWINNCGCESAVISVHANKFITMKLVWRNPAILIRRKTNETAI